MPDYVSALMPDSLDTTSPMPFSEKSIIGAYGPWAAGLVNQPPALSFRNKQWKSIDKWREEALAKTLDLAAPPKIEKTPSVKIVKKYTYDGLDIEELTWQLPYGNKTEAILLKPTGSTGRLPAVLGLHDHGGNKYFGTRKITKTSDDQHPMMTTHQDHYYGGRAWANELAKRGYVVLVWLVLFLGLLGFFLLLCVVFGCCGFCVWWCFLIGGRAGCVVLFYCLWVVGGCLYWGGVFGHVERMVFVVGGSMIL
ncbi:MAG: hypothetical protein U5K79_22890 [Cyclobacteriaceae bacterium]|nr:hypothetical protein [Cyclobacteriaceae bacterium]